MARSPRRQSSVKRRDRSTRIASPYFGSPRASMKIALRMSRQSQVLAHMAGLNSLISAVDSVSSRIFGVPDTGALGESPTLVVSFSTS